MAISDLRAGTWFPPFLLLISLASAHAEDDDSGFSKEDQEIETVQVTATRNEARVQDISAAVSSVSQEQVRSEAPDVLPEMLRGLPGTWFQQTTPGQGIPIIRGLKGSQVLHLVDGMRVNNAFFRDAPNQYLGLVDPFAMDRVEVVRGASPSLYGADAMGGVVNFLTATPSYQGEAWQQDSTIYGSYNSSDDGLVIRAETRAGKDGYGFTGGVSFQDHSDRKTGSGETVSPSGYRSEATNLKWFAELGDSSELMISAQLLEQPSTPRTDELVPGYGQDQPASEQFAFEPNRRSFIHARYRSDNPGPWLDSFQVNVARQVITDDRLSQDLGSPLVRTEENRSKLDGITFQFDHDFASSAHLSWGLEYYADTVDSQRRETHEDTGASAEVRSRFPDGSSMDSFAAYASTQWNPADRWTLGAGLRYSDFDIHLPGAGENPDANLSPSDLTGDFRLLYEINPTLNLVANIGRGFRPPNIFDLGTLGNRPGNRFNIANPTLDPESVLSYDLGLKAQSGDFQAELFAFYLDYRDKITSVETGEITPGGRTVVRSENRNEVILYGLEAGFHWTRPDGYMVYGSLNHTRGDETDEGVNIAADRVPPLNARLGLKFEPMDNVRIDTFAQFAGRQDRLSPRDVNDPRINPNGTPSWLSLNMIVGWTVNEQVELGLRLENLADRDYREHGSGIDAPGFNLGLWASFSL